MSLRTNKLPLDAKRHIIRALARRVPHADIVNQVAEMFGVTVNRRALAHYHPKYNARLAPELRAIYEEEKAQVWREMQEETERWRAQRQQAHDEALARSRAALRAKMLDSLRASLQNDAGATTARGRPAKGRK